MLDLFRRLVARRGLECVAGAGAVHQDAFLPERGARLGEACIDFRIRRHVHFAKDAAESTRQRFTLLGVEIEDRNFDTERCERTRRRGTEPRRTAGDDSRDVRIELHDYMRSTIVTLYRPPPSHIVCNP